MASNDLTRVDDRGTAVVEMTDKLPADIAVSSLPTSIKTGLQDLMIAFPAGVQQDIADKRRLAQIYCEACAGHSLFVIGETLLYLRFHNPRNPFAPSPQDVFELCEKVREDAVYAVSGYYFSGHPWKRTGKYVRLGGAPGEADCRISEQLACALLRDYFIAHEHYAISQIADLPDEHFARLPKSTFTDDGYQWLATEQQRRSAIRKECEAYRDSQVVRNRTHLFDDDYPKMQVVR